MRELSIPQKEETEWEKDWARIQEECRQHELMREFEANEKENRWLMFWMFAPAIGFGTIPFIIILLS